MNIEPCLRKKKMDRAYKSDIQIYDNKINKCKRKVILIGLMTHLNDEWTNDMIDQYISSIDSPEYALEHGITPMIAYYMDRNRYDPHSIMMKAATIPNTIIRQKVLAQISPIYICTRFYFLHKCDKQIGIRNLDYHIGKFVGCDDLIDIVIKMLVL
jgi:hypothetical protein